jgi:hypothetical protein
MLLTITIWNQLHTLIVCLCMGMLSRAQQEIKAFDHINLEPVAHPYCLPVCGNACLGTTKKLVIITIWNQLHTLIVCLCVGMLA